MSNEGYEQTQHFIGREISETDFMVPLGTIREPYQAEDLSGDERILSNDTYENSCEQSSEIKEEVNDNQSNLATDGDSQIKDGDRNSEADRKLFGCEQCTYETVDGSNLTKHRMVHSNTYPFSCSICIYKARRKWTLKEHMIMKHGEKGDYQCDQCSFTINQPGILKHHILRTHSKIYRFTCPICDYRACQKTRLKRHMVSKHDRKWSFTCDQCDYAPI